MPIKDEGPRSLAHLRPDLSAEWDHVKNLPLTPQFVTAGSNRKVHWLCAQGHSWIATPTTRNQGHGCAACRGMVATAESNLAVDRPDLLASWDYERNMAEYGLTPAGLKSKSSRKVYWTCPIDDRHGYDARVYERAIGNGCPFCAGKRVSESNSISGQRPILAIEWDPSNDRESSSVSTGSDYRAKWICRFDPSHKWTAVVSSRPADGTGCPFCDGKRPSDRNRLDLIRPDLAAQWHPTKNGDLRPDQVSVGSSKRVWWLCPNDPEHPWYVTPAARSAGDGCAWCAPMIRSLQDIRIAAEFEHVFPGEVDPGSTQRRFNLGHNRPYTVDVLLDARKVVIEFDGSYYHSGPEHEGRDKRKTAGLTALGYCVVRIRENPLRLLDDQLDLTVPRGASIKAIVDSTLLHLAALGKVKMPEISEYLAEPGEMAAVRANDIIADLTPSERFVPPSHKSAGRLPG